MAFDSSFGAAGTAQPYGALTTGSVGDVSGLAGPGLGVSTVREVASGVTGWENVVIRVPTHNHAKTLFVPGPVITRPVATPPREIVQRVQQMGPEQLQKVVVQGPPQVVVRKVAVQGPPREVVRRVQVQGPPREVVQKVQVQGPPREIVKRVEVQGPPREVIKRVEIAGPPREVEVKVQVAKVGPPREVERQVPMPRDVVRQVIKNVNVDQVIPTPVQVPGPAQEIVIKVRDPNLFLEHERLKNEIKFLRSQQAARDASSGTTRKRSRRQHEHDLSRSMRQQMGMRPMFPPMMPMHHAPAYHAPMSMTIGGYAAPHYGGSQYGVIHAPPAPIHGTWGGYQAPVNPYGSIGAYPTLRAGAPLPYAGAGGYPVSINQSFGY